MESGTRSGKWPLSGGGPRPPWVLGTFSGADLVCFLPFLLLRAHSTTVSCWALWVLAPRGNSGISLAPWEPVDLEGSHDLRENSGQTSR